jgi:transposase
VRIEIVKDVSAETLLKEIIKKVKRGSIIYTDMWKGYDTLVIYGFLHLRIYKSIKFSNGKVYINGIEGFWSYAKERLMRYHGISRELFPYYLKELEFRYNNRNSNLFEKILEILKSG